MSFDEAKLVLAAHGQEILGDLFQPCTWNATVPFQSGESASRR